MSWSTAAIALLLLALPAAAQGQARGDLSASLSAGVDSNPGRVLGETSADGLLALTATAKGRAALGELHLLAGRLDFGLRKFALDGSEDVWVQQAEGSWSRKLGFAVAGVDLAGKLRRSRSATRDYTDGTAGGFVELPLGAGLALRLGLGGRLFLYEDPDYDSAGPQADLSLRWSPRRRLALSAGAAGALPEYRGAALGRDFEERGFARSDRQVSGWLKASYRGPVALQAGYLWGKVASNSFAESMERHRLSAAVSARLGPRLFLMTQAAWQLIRYSDGLVARPDLLLEDDEAQSSASGKLAWTISDRVELEGRYGIYWITLPTVPPGTSGSEAIPSEYLRQVAHAGVVLRW